MLSELSGSRDAFQSDQVRRPGYQCARRTISTTSGANVASAAAGSHAERPGHWSRASALFRCTGLPAA
jgi:hypothetical protein